MGKDDPSPSEPCRSRENLDVFPQVSYLIADSLPGSLSGSPMAVDVLDSVLADVLEGETVANPRLSETLSTTDDVFSSDPQSPLPYTDSALSQLPALVPYDSNKPFDCQEKKDRYRSSYFSGSSMVCDQFDGRRENKCTTPVCSTWTPWGSGPWSLKESSRTEDKPTGVGAGLGNLGNTCFMNAVLQCFTHTVPFVLGLRSLNHHGKPCDRYIEGFCLLCALRDHIELSLNSSGGVVFPSKIFDNLNYISSCFQRYHQEDAHEFLQCLLDRLESCCSDLNIKNILSSPDDNLVKKVFGGRLVSRLCCCNCGHISYTYEPLNDLSLEIEDMDSLPAALESFTKVEKIEDLQMKFTCNNCEKEVSVEKQLMLDQAPSIATFHLKRFKTAGTFVEKIDKHVVFPLELDLLPYTVVTERSKEEFKYQLYAVVKHSGLGPTSGHYVCYIRSSPNTWHELNDSRVTSVAEEAVLSQEAYILLYAKQGIDWFSAAIEVQKPYGDTGISDSSPKSVLDLDDTECASNPLVENSTDSATDESKDVADKASILFPAETLSELEVDEMCVTGEVISGPPANESEIQVSKSIDSTDDNPMIEASISPGSNNCSDEFGKYTSTVSHSGENNCNHGVAEATNYSSFTRTPSVYKRLRDSSGCRPDAYLKEEKRGLHRRAATSPATDQGRIEAMRYARRMPSTRGAKFMALLAPQTAGRMKKSRMIFS
ncbi:hypothetical protein DITRI_Ditri07aG0169800 [Diplodiscus trichospermus]